MVMQEKDSDEDSVQVYHTGIPHQHHNRLGIDKAKITEIESLKKLYTFEDKKMSELMDDQKKKIIRSTWVIVWKGSVQTYAGITLI